MKNLLSLFLFIVVAATGFMVSSCGSRTGSTDSKNVDSLSLLTEQIHKDAKNASLFSQRARLNLQKKKLPDAILDATYAFKIDSLNPAYCIQLCEYLILHSESEKARDVLLKGHKLLPMDVNILLKLGELYLFVQQYKDALDYLQMAEDINKNLPRLHFLKGMIFKEKGDTIASINDFRASIELDPSYYDAYVQLGLLFYHKHDSLSAEYYKTAIRLKPKSIEAHYNLGMFYQENKRENKAIDEYNAIIKNIDSNYVYAWFNIGYINMEYFKKYNIAVKYFENAFHRDSNYVAALYNEGYCLEKLGQPAQAKTIYMKCMKKVPNYELAIDGLNRIEKRSVK